MCKCTPNIKTPFCGKPGCERPDRGETIDVFDWFDVKSGEHMLAWDRLSKTGSWPEGFIPDNVRLPPSWQLGLALKMANAWADHRLGRD